MNKEKEKKTKRKGKIAIISFTRFEQCLNLDYLYFSGNRCLKRTHTFEAIFVCTKMKKKKNTKTKKEERIRWLEITPYIIVIDAAWLRRHKSWHRN